MLGEGTISWVAGAVHWTKEDLILLNTLQMHILRDIFHIHRQVGENWVDYNQRSLRMTRAWIHANAVPRWSTKVRLLQHSIAGHWCRQVEDDGRGISAKLGIPARFLLWRNLEWWKAQQRLSVRVGGLRHPRQFYPANLEREIAEILGVTWMQQATDRDEWNNLREKWVSTMDVQWARGRQAAIECY